MLAGQGPQSLEEAVLRQDDADVRQRGLGEDGGDVPVAQLLLHAVVRLHRPETILDAFERGAVDYLLKPVTAERLAAGNLDERMRVRGEDDIARLATSFNAMASSLQRQIGQLEDLSHLQQRFTSDVSHELRTPLTTIRMAADMIHDSRGDFAAHVARSSELLSKELDRFESLLADLLEISRFDAGGAVLADGHNLTTAAVEAGFASPSHLADRFKTTFGLSATQLLATGLTIRVP